MRTTTTILATLGALASIACTAHAQYTATLLHPTGFTTSKANGASGGSQVGQGTSPATGSDHALLWSGTAESRVDLNPDGVIYSVASGASGNHQVGVGLGPSTNFSVNAFLWSGTAASAVNLHPTNLTGFSSSLARGVSGNTQVGHGSGTATDGAQHALLWTGTAGSAVDLNPAGFASSYAFGVSGTNQVGMGTSAVPGSAPHALLWTGTAASVIDLNGAFNASIAWATSGSQQVGYAIGSIDFAVLWSGTASSSVVLHPSGFDYSYAYGVAGNTQVGVGRDSATNKDHALLWHGTAGSVVDLHSFLTGLPLTFEHSFATGIDEVTGDIVGYGTVAGSPNEYALRWSTSVGVASAPEPGTLALLLLGGAALVRRARRTR